MENSPKQHENQNPTHLPSPNRHSPNSSSSSSSSNSNGLQQQQQQPPPTPTTPSPKPITRSESNNPYPTTFVQADTSSFKQVVQMLTGSSETAKQASSHKPASDPPPTKNPIPPRRQQGFKLYERRNSVKNFKISPLLPGFNPNPNSSGFSPRNKPEILSPSILDFPSLVLSPVTPLMTDPFNRSPHHHNHNYHHHYHHQQNKNNKNNNNNGSCRNGGGLDTRAEEDKAIAEKGFYLHKSPATTPRDSEPRLLPLFPVTSPRVSGSSTS